VETLFVLLTTSLFLNLMLFRWGIRERSARKMWQQEASALQHALRHPNHPLPFHLRSANAGIWLVGGLIFFFCLLAVLSL
jgi:hypothetical protein